MTWPKKQKKLAELAASGYSTLFKVKYLNYIKPEKINKTSISNDIFISLLLDNENPAKYISEPINQISKEDKKTGEILLKYLSNHPEAYVYLEQQKDEIQKGVYNSEDNVISDVSHLGKFFLESSELVAALSGTAPQARQAVSVHDLPPVHEGPLDKTESTYLLEELIEALLSVKSLDEIVMTTQHETIEITVNGARYSLTCLLKNANLTHVFLSDDQIVRLQALLALTVHGEAQSVYSIRRLQCGNGRGIVAGGPFEHLPQACIEAIFAYTYADHTYLSMNALMQGNLKHFNQLKSLKYISSLLMDQPFKDNILLMLGLNLLVHHALNILPLHLSQNYHEDLTKLQGLTRLEHFVDHDTPTDDFMEIAIRARYASLQVRQARLNRVTAYTALTSTTKKADPLYFQTYNTVTHYTNQANVWPIASISSCVGEGEVILPASTQVYTTLDLSAPNDGKVHLKASFVRSPDFQQDRYWPDVSFLHALDKYLTQYADLPESVEVAGKAVVRHNHGAAHAYRKKMLVRYVFDYLSRYATHLGHEAYAEFSETLLQYLEIAAIRTGIGRESEKPSLKYREASKNHFLAFCADYKPFRKLADQERFYLESSISYIVYILGNPNYAAEIQAVSQDADHENLLHCIYHVLNLTHMLDLLRCFDATSYGKKVAPYRAESVDALTPDLVVANDHQAESFNELLRYSHELMQAHGNMQMTVVNQGRLSSSSLFYRSPFHKVSRRRQLLEIASASVFPPVIK